MDRIRPDGTHEDDCPIGPRWNVPPRREDTAMRRIRMWFWDFLYHAFTRLSTCCSAHYIKAKYGTYPAWYRK